MIQVAATCLNACCIIIIANFQFQCNRFFQLIYYSIIKSILYRFFCIFLLGEDSVWFIVQLKEL